MTEIYFYAGFKIHVVRHHERIIEQYALPMLVMVVIAVCSTLIPTSGTENFRVDRTGLLSGSILSSILVFQSAVKHNPDMSMNPLMQYIIIGLFFILLSFLQYWFLSVTWFSVRRQRQIDIGYLVITFLAYLVFVYYLF